MFRSLMTIIRELYLYLTKVIFMLKHSVRLRRYMHYVMWQHVYYVCLSYFVSEKKKGYYFVNRKEEFDILRKFYCKVPSIHNN